MNFYRVIEGFKALPRSSPGNTLNPFAPEAHILPIKGLYFAGDTVDGAIGMIRTLVSGARRAQQIVDPESAKSQQKLGIFGL